MGGPNSGGGGGRKSKLTDEQWIEVLKRLLAGESMGELAKVYGITKSTISQRMGDRKIKIETVANQMVRTDAAFNSLHMVDRLITNGLVEELKSISLNLASAAKYGAITANKTAKLANFSAEMLSTTAADEENMKYLRTAAAYTAVSNEAAKTPLALLAANKESVSKINTEKEITEDVGLLDDVEASNAYLRLRNQ